MQQEILKIFRSKYFCDGVFVDYASAQREPNIFGVPGHVESEFPGPLEGEGL